MAALPDEPLAFVALAVVAALALPTFKSFIFTSPKPKMDQIYQDEDGVATHDSESACADTIPRALLRLGAAMGLSASVFQVCCPGLYSEQAFLHSSWSWILIWVLISIQAVAASGESSVHKRYNHGIACAISAFIALAIAIRKVLLQFGQLSQLISPIVIAALSILFGLGSLHRRPAVFLDSSPVDQETTVSLLAMLSFSWYPFHRTGIGYPDSLDLQDLPAVASNLRARNLRAAFGSRERSSRLWKRLIGTFWVRLGQQLLLVVVKVVSEFGSRLALHRLLQALEKPALDASEARLWVLLLGVALTFDAIAGGWLAWITQMKLQMPIIALLKALIFEKMTRRQITYEDNSLRDDNSARKIYPHLNSSLTDMMSNDSSSISQACAHSHHFPMAFIKLSVNIIYLSRLVGLKCVVTGAMASLLLVPLSLTLSQKQRVLQRQLLNIHGDLSSLIAETLQGLRQIRLSSTERLWKGKILDLRAKELQCLSKVRITLAFSTLMANLGPIILASVALSLYAFQSGYLKPSVAFASLSLFGNLYKVFRQLPTMADNMHASWISCERLQRYLDEPEIAHCAMPSPEICLEDASLSWPERVDASPSPYSGTKIHDVNVTFPRGKLSVITGKSGSGKTLLGLSLLEESHIASGWLRKPAAGHNKIHNGSIVTGTAALVCQPPWIEAVTVRENIVFGYPFDESRYKKVLHACALEEDIRQLSEGDMTKTGLQGATLSGGQKWRVALARALYSPAEMLIIEDVFSAVDVPVARWILDHALTGELARDRTRVLITHHPEFCLAAASYLVTVRDGAVSGTDKFSKKSRSFGTQEKSIDDGGFTASAVPQVDKQELQSSLPRTEWRQPSRKRRKAEVLSKYLEASGSIKRACAIGFAATLGYQLSSASHSWWLSRWTAASDEDLQDATSYNICIYLALSLGSGAVFAIQSLAFNRISLGASLSLYDRIVSSVLGATSSWIDNTPLGQVLQSFQADMHIVDHRFAFELNGFLGSVVHLILIAWTSFLSAPYTAFSSIGLILLYVRLTRMHFRASRRVKRLVPIADSPILEHAQSTAAGITTIRAFDKRQRYIERNYDLIDNSTKVGWYLALGMRWIHLRLAILSTLFVIITAAALLHQEVTAATMGFAITIAFQLKSALSGMLSKNGIVNMGSNAVNRILNLADIPAEPQDGEEPSQLWPTKGNIHIQNLTVSYGPHLPLALRSISLHIQSGQRIGIVGRTGAGKTSLTNAILRFIDITPGSIIIDDHDISTVKLARLRRAINIVPQDPFLFSGTLRSNLDVRGDRSDSNLRSALRRVHLISDDEASQDGFHNLDMAIQSGGVNLSHGQCQLVCLARAILAQCRILILDEATSAMDSATNRLIQDVVRREFADATILVVAHNLATVADFDTIVVLRNGELVELGSPGQLMAAKGIFWDMARKSEDGETTEAAIRKQ